jgi:hypothetical protein
MYGFVDVMVDEVFSVVVNQSLSLAMQDFDQDLFLMDPGGVSACGVYDDCRTIPELDADGSPGRALQSDGSIGPIVPRLRYRRRRS